jgi:hypothetical protein
MTSPFLSEIGSRAFYGLSGDLVPGLSPEDYVREAIAVYVRGNLKKPKGPPSDLSRDGLPLLNEARAAGVRAPRG